MAKSDCDRCPAYGLTAGDEWTCSKCSDRFRWDGSRWGWVDAPPAAETTSGEA